MAMNIHMFAERGDLEGLARMLTAGVAIDDREQFGGRTPLMFAAASPRAGLTTVRWLVEHGADVNACSWTPATAPAEALAQIAPESREYQWNGVTALLLAASARDAAIVQYLLDAGADIAATTTHGYDALINTLYGDARRTETIAPLVALLLAHGAAPDRRTTYGESPLKSAAAAAMFDVVALLLAAGADATQLRWTPLMHAVVFGSLADMHAVLSAGTPLEARDVAGRTALHLSLEVGDLDKARALRTAGAAFASGAADGRSVLTYAITPSSPTLLAWLLQEGCDPEAATSYGETPLMEAARAGAAAAVRLLLDAGARVDRTNQFGDRALTNAATPEVTRHLLAAGADIQDVSDEMRKALFGLPADATLDLPRETYLAGKHRRFGQANPELQDEPFWQAMIRSRASAYTARQQFDDTSYGDAAVWCFARFGRSLTALPDGRYVEIGGEHEDFYDPDFCIYNDVVVYAGDGSFTLYGYPEAIFPPIDFHTATLVGSVIYLIGALGYRGTRHYSETPVYRLDCASWQIGQVRTSGQQPGWISRHTAVYDPDAQRIIVQGGKRCIRGEQPKPPTADGHTSSEQVGDDAQVQAEQYVVNEAAYALDLATLVWQQLMV